MKGVRPKPSPGRAAMRKAALESSPYYLKKELYMDYQIIYKAITDFGFPIAVCGVLFWVLLKIQKQHKEESETMAASLDAMRSSLETNTKVLSELGVFMKYIADHLLQNVRKE